MPRQNSFTNSEGHYLTPVLEDEPVPRPPARRLARPSLQALTSSQYPGPPASRQQTSPSLSDLDYVTAGMGFLQVTQPISPGTAVRETPVHRHHPDTAPSFNNPYPPISSDPSTHRQSSTSHTDFCNCADCSSRLGDPYNNRQSSACNCADCSPSLSDSYHNRQSFDVSRSSTQSTDPNFWSQPPPHLAATSSQSVSLPQHGGYMNAPSYPSLPHQDQPPGHSGPYPYESFGHFQPSVTTTPENSYPYESFDHLQAPVTSTPETPYHYPSSGHPQMPVASTPENDHHSYTCLWLLGDNTLCRFQGALNVFWRHFSINHIPPNQNTQVECRWKDCDIVDALWCDTVWRHVRETHLSVGRRIRLGPRTTEGASQESTGSAPGPLRDLTNKIEVIPGYPTASGGFGDIWKCSLMNSRGAVQQTVAVKVIRAFQSDDEALMQRKKRRVRRELVVWGRLNHECILQLLGVSWNFGPYPAMICPWADKGALTGYLERQRGTLSYGEKISLLHDIARGLQYLHSKSVVHGDLTGSNVLVRDNGRACLADFGLSTVILEFIGTSYYTQTTHGGVRWAAAELFDVPDDAEADERFVSLSFECDIYSFGSIALQVLTCKVPYHNVRNEIAVLAQIIRGIKPVRPREPYIVEAHWQFIQRCWSHRASRPSVREIVAFVQNEVDNARYRIGAF